MIPIETARGFSEKALARKYVNGTEKTTGSPPAFMYVLFYNDALCKASVKADHSRASAAQSSRRAAKPYAEVLPYPAVYFNTRYFPWFPWRFSGMDKKGLLHEAGHLLGLVRRPTGVSGHCTNRTCLMNSYVSLRRVLLGQQKKLCPQCAAELAESSTDPPPSNLRFVGAVLARSEIDYHVLSLPDRLLLLVGDFTEERSEDFAARVHAETPGAKGSMRVICLARGEVLGDSVKVNHIINGFKNDPFEVVRREGLRALLRVCVDRYYSVGQYSNVVAMLHQATLSDPKDDWSYNRLAWIQATCPDGAVRNGHDALAAASKACELTEWRNWRCIDTLAAAYAEAGDFKRAVEFEEQALRTGNPSELEQKVMRERVALFKDSQPFRENSDKP